MAPVTRNENQGMFRKLKDSVLSTAERYKGEMCELSPSLNWRLLKGFVTYSAN